MPFIDEVARIGQVDRLKHDDYLKTMIPLLIEFAGEKCNNTFNQTDEKGEPNPPAGVKIFIGEAIKHKLSVQGISSRSMGSVSYSYDMDFPNKVIKYLNPYKKLRW